MTNLTIHIGNALTVLKNMPDNSVHCVVTSPPYWGLRDYKIDPVKWPGCSYVPMPGLKPVRIPGMKCVLGLEPTLEAFIAHVVLIFREVHRVLHASGTMWVNMGDASASNAGGYDCNNSRGRTANTRISKKAQTATVKDKKRMKKLNGLKPKDIMGQPWRLAFALQADGWYLRRPIIWYKLNPMPESSQDRPTCAHEEMFLLSKSLRYYYDRIAIQEPASEDTHARVSKAAANARGVDARDATLALPHNWAQSPNFHDTLPFKIPAGWDTSKGEGGHGVIHKTGRRHKVSDRQHTKNNVSMYAALAIMPLVRNKRDVWPIASEPYKAAHFATFPKALVLPCVRAGTSARGACPICGAPWVRIIFRSEHHNPVITSPFHTGKTGSRPTQNIDTTSDAERTLEHSVGWRPTCRCDGRGWHKNPSTKMGTPRRATRRTGWSRRIERRVTLQPVPCTVLDIFAGSGTTGQVALTEGRSAVLIDAAEHHRPLILDRCSAITPPLAPDLI